MRRASALRAGAFVARFVTKKRVFESDVKVGGFQPHGLAELLARGFGIACLQQCVGEVLADIGAAGERAAALPKKEMAVS